MDIPLLSDIVILFALGIVIVYACHMMRIPTIVGFLLTGVLAGPHGMGLISAVHEVELLAEIGVVLLLFTIGLEFSMQSLWQLKRSVLLGGSFQVLVTLIATFGIAMGVGKAAGEAVFLGFTVSLSSTAIVLRLLQQRAEMDSPHGKINLSVLIFQDVVAVPMMLLVPLLKGGAGGASAMFLPLFAKGVAIVAFAIVSARWVVPQILFRIAATRNRELFLLTVVVMCLSVAWLTSSIGLSPALGAFLAGLIISESEYSYQALSNLLPFRDLFTSLFFISIGMLVDFRVLLGHPGEVGFLVVGVMGLKTAIAGGAAAILGYPLRTMILSGLAISQIGEFSFILAKSGVEHGLLTGEGYQIFLAVSVFTMAATPFIIAGGPSIANILLFRGEKLKFSNRPTDSETANPLRDHLIIVGFGLNGRNVARAARSAGIPYTIVEMNPVTVKREKARGEPIHYGDASQEAVLHHVDVHQARIMMVAIPDPIATRMVVASARSVNPRLHIITRTRFLPEVKHLYDLGANEVVPEEFETSVEILSRVLAGYFVPFDEIEKFAAQVRGDGYGMLRKLSEEAMAFCDASACDYRLYLPDVKIASLRVKDGAQVAGQSLAKAALRRRYGVTVLSIRRGSDIFSNPGGDAVFQAGDVVVLAGEADRIARVRHFFTFKDAERSGMEAEAPV
jgi:CPA2 family monovalent cation:H+ antiporter-2